MAGDQFKRVVGGDPLVIPASTWNAILEVVGDWRRIQRELKLTVDPFVRQSGIFLCKNNAGSDLSRFSILGIGAPIITSSDNLEAFQERPTFIGGAPDTALHRGKFAVPLEPIPSGEIGRVCIDGVTVARVSKDLASDRWVDVADNDTAALTTVPYPSGAQLLWSDSGTGTVWSIIRLGARVAPTLIRFQLADDLYPGLGSPVDAYPVDLLGTWVGDETETIKVYDPLDRMRGRGTTGGSSAVEGSRGMAIWPYEDNEPATHEIVRMEHAARWIELELTEDLTTAMSSVAGTVSAFFDGYSPDPGSTGIKVVNTFTMFEGSSGDSALCYAAPENALTRVSGTSTVSDPGYPEYRIVQMPCPA